MILGLTMCLTSCAIEKTTLKPALKVNVSNVSLDKKSFNPSKGEVVKIRYRLPKQANVTIRIYDSDDNLVRTLEPKGIDRKGYNERVWDGKDDLSHILPKEAYIYTIEAKDISSGEFYVYDTADETGGIELVLRGLNFDNKTGQIDYILPKAARVRIRIGIEEGGPLLRTLLDWQPMEAGKHTVVWNGKDSSGVMNLLGNPNVFVNISSFSLPENSIILEGPVEQAFIERTVLEKRPVKKTDIKKSMHALHKRAKCHEPRFDFEILDIKEYKDKDTPVIEGAAHIRVRLDEQDKLDLINSRFEIIFFIDSVFLFEEEEGTSPFTYRLDTKGLNEGEHILTLNIYGYEDHIASRSKRIFIRRKE